ncbi:MAG: 16S rRNA (uracil(1498)-N(3))-methyltransferase [Candidatus Eremiobacteraeota bacterium]|nr:16S rRNA (uracil(1498)-N(3))-methyltransferase [Candidatus Eremiobacteraeota bacterium]
MSTAARFFIEGVHAPGDAVELCGADARKIRVVLRLRAGDPIRLIDSGGTTFEARVTGDGPRVRAELGRAIQSAPATRSSVTVAQAIPKGQKMDFVVEKLTELGVASIVPFQSERSVPGCGEAKLERWRRLARTAALQCGRSDVPSIVEPSTLPALLEQFHRFDRVLMPWELADPVPLREILPGLLLRAGRLLVIVGPEGGFSHEEATGAVARGASALWLGNTILRTETAALVFMAILRYCTDM